MENANPTETTIQEEPKEPERTFTQADVDAAVNARLRDERKKHASELAKFSDYEDFKAKAAKYDELEEAKKSELEKANEAAQSAIKRAEEAEADEKAEKEKKPEDDPGAKSIWLEAKTEDELLEKIPAMLSLSESS